MNNKKLLLIFLVLLFACTEKTPDLRFNHLYFVIDQADLEAIKASGFFNDTLVVTETRTTYANNQESWTGTYFYSESNYIEVFGNDNDEGLVTNCGIAFSVDRIGDINVLKKELDKSYETLFFRENEIMMGRKFHGSMDYSLMTRYSIPNPPLISGSWNTKPIILILTTTPSMIKMN